MNTNRPYILISNDDGINADGIRFLINTLKEFASVLTVAPEGARSGFSCAITSTLPVSTHLQIKEPDLIVYSCTGTPVDCVKVALNKYVERRPDLIVGGINHGDNSSVNSHYSGTMGVAFEGAMQGIPSIAFSICDHGSHPNFAPLKPYITDIVKKVLQEGLPPFTCLNVNFPDRTSFKGIRLCRMAESRWEKEYVKCPHPYRTDDIFWLTGECRELEPEATDTDRCALAQGFVAITPTTLDNTAYDLLKKWKNKF